MTEMERIQHRYECLVAEACRKDTQLERRLAIRKELTAIRRMKRQIKQKGAIQMEIKNVYAYYVPTGRFDEKGREIHNWGLTLDEAEAKKLDPSSELATRADLDDWGCVGGFFRDEAIRVQEGVYRWNPKAIEEKDWVRETIEYYGDYEQVEV